MKNWIFIWLFFLPLQDYPLKNGKPTSEGIERYVVENADVLIREFQDFIGDTLYDVVVYAQDLTNYVGNDSVELGRYYANEVIISTAELFLAYELDDLSRIKRAMIDDSNKFVKAAIFHELTHDYIEQIIREATYIDKIRIDPSYRANFWIIHSHEMHGARFIEEGICEYVIWKMGEIITPKKPLIPKNIDYLTNRKNNYQVNYKYAAYFLKDFLDANDLKEGIKILMHNPPPTFEEMLEPDLFFGRLEYIDL